MPQNIAQGQELVIQVDPDDTSTFTDFAGIISTDFSMGPELVDRTVPVTDGDRTKPAQKTSRAGTLDFNFSGTGVADMQASTKSILDAARTGVSKTFKVIVPGYGSFTGKCFAKITFTGATNEDLAISAEFGWEDVPTFAAAV